MTVYINTKHVSRMRFVERGLKIIQRGLEPEVIYTRTKEEAEQIADEIKKGYGSIVKIITQE